MGNQAAIKPPLVPCPHCPSQVKESNLERHLREQHGRQLSAPEHGRPTPAPTRNLDALSGVEFERLIAQLLTRIGFRTQLTKASGDGGIDIVATLDRLFMAGRYLIQCKRYAADSPVGVAKVREFCGACASEHAVKGILVATSGFTREAEEYARKVSIELIGRRQLEGLLSQHGLRGQPPGASAETFSASQPGSPIGELRSDDLTVFYPPEWAADRLYEEAEDCLNRGRTRDALLMFEEVVARMPEFVDAWSRVGLARLHLARYVEAESALREAVRLDPNHTQSWNTLKRLYAKIGNQAGVNEAQSRLHAVLSLGRPPAP